MKVCLFIFILLGECDVDGDWVDLSTRFTTLLTQKHNANRVIKELTPLEEGIQDHEALDDWIRMMKGKVDMITDEMKRLQDKIACKCASHARRINSR